MSPRFIHRNGIVHFHYSNYIIKKINRIKFVKYLLYMFELKTDYFFPLKDSSKLSACIVRLHNEYY